MVGSLALLLGTERSATVVAESDRWVLEMTRAAHEGLAERLDSDINPLWREVLVVVLRDPIASANSHLRQFEARRAALLDRVVDILGRRPAAELPPKTVCKGWGLLDFKRTADVSAFPNSNAVAREANDATLTIREYFRKVLLDRKKNPQRDFLSGMLEAQDRYNLTDDELISQAAMMLVAGQVTTTDQICNNLFLMLDDPATWQKLVDDPSLVPNAQEEFKRFDPAVNFLFRVARERVVINGQRIDAGDTVFMASHCLNRDPDVYDDPDTLDIEREDIRHFAYGQGGHYCIGAYLGRLQMNALFTRMVTDFPNLRFSGTPVRDHYSLAFSGFLDMPLEV